MAIKCKDCGREWDLYSPPYDHSPACYKHYCNGHEVFALAHELGQEAVDAAYASKSASKRNAAMYAKRGGDDSDSTESKE